MITELVGAGAPWQEWPLSLLLGTNSGDPFGEFVDDDYAVRLCMAVDEARGGLVMFNDDMQAGVRVQLMRKSVEPAYMRSRIELLMQRIGDRRPFFAIHIDCQGRQSRLSHTDGEEAEEVQRALRVGLPLLGFNSGCEIARSGPVMQSHNWTGVRSIFSEER